MRRPSLAILLLALAGGADGASLFGDDAGTRPFEAEGPALCYGPHRDGQRPGGLEPSAEELREDLALMSPRWKLLRVYGSGGFAGDLLQIIREDGIPMKVMLGAWIAPESDEANRAELETAARLAREYPEIVSAVSVGNETQVFWTAHRCPLDTLIGYVRQAREAVEQPVTVADDYNFWNKPESRALAAEIDFITLHAHPLWNGLQLEGALPWLKERLGETRSLHPDRLVVIGETGWATRVADEGEQARLIRGKAGEAEQAVFYRELRQWGEDEDVTVCFFEAFDENWKGGPHPDEVEKHWGLFRADRTPKAAMEASPSR